MDSNGVVVGTHTAMCQATVWACVRILSEIIAQLPIEVHKRQNGSWVHAENHDISTLLASPNHWQTQHDLISHLVAWSELSGNGYLYKMTDLEGRARKLIPVESTAVSLDVLNTFEMRYALSSKHGISGIYGADSVFHYRNFASDGYRGLSTIGNHSRGIGLAIDLENHAVNSYKNGLQSRNWIELEEELGEAEKADFRREIKTKLSGASNAGEVPVLHGAKIHPIGGLSAVDAQYIESRRMQKQEIASIFGVPLFLLNDTEKSTTWGTGLEQLSRSFVRFSLNPRLNRLGQTLIRELVPEKQRLRTRIIFDTDQFTLGEFKERMDGYKSGIEAGVISPNEAREVEGRNPREGGDDYRKPLNIGIEGEANEQP